eukprot:682138_1
MAAEERLNQWMISLILAVNTLHWNMISLIVIAATNMPDKRVRDDIVRLYLGERGDSTVNVTELVGAENANIMIFFSISFLLSVFVRFFAMFTFISLAGLFCVLIYNFCLIFYSYSM